MADGHVQRLSALDAAFLHLETAATHMDVGAVAVFEGPAPSRDELVDRVRSRLHLMPRHVQRVRVPRGIGRPEWVDDPAFDVERHVRRATLAAPGGDQELMDLAARAFSRGLDRSRPLWELWLVDGLAGGGFALISRTHHAMIDGIAGVELAQRLLDEPPDGPLLEQPRPAPPRTSPRRSGVVAILRSAPSAIRGVIPVGRAFLHPASRTPLNVPIGPGRRLAVVRARLDDVRLVKDAFGTTVNDVVLAVVAGGLRRWLRERGIATDGLELHALVPVSVRAEAERDAGGNRLSAMRGTLPVWAGDPVERLRTARHGMDRVKASGQAAGAALLMRIGNAAPPAVLAWGARLAVSTRLFNLIVTNVPGPPHALSLRGRALVDVFPVAVLPRDHALAVAVFSYDGRLGFGLLADREAMPDVGTVAAGIEAELAELVRRARNAAGGAGDAGGAPGATGAER
jgi:diacylglycerol O-acyltransferase / wax synthase